MENKKKTNESNNQLIKCQVSLSSVDISEDTQVLSNCCFSRSWNSNLL